MPETKSESIELGDRAKDKVTGFAGVVVAITTWLNGCDRLTLQPEQLGKDGKPQESQTVDRLQLQLVKKRAVVGQNNTKAKATTGGPRNDKAALRRN